MLIAMHPSVNPGGPAVPPLAGAFHEIVRMRRSVYAYADADVPRELIESALCDAVLAPNHHRTSPWRFFVIRRESRFKLEAAYEAAARRIGRDASRAKQRAQDAPVNVVVGCVPALHNPRVVKAEEEFATAAAVQTFMLSLAAAGVGTLLTTGDLAQSQEVAALVAPDDAKLLVMGVINVGLRNPERPIPQRLEKPIAEISAWI
jgi:nitroreductase